MTLQFYNSEIFGFNIWKNVLPIFYVLKCNWYTVPHWAPQIL